MGDDTMKIDYQKLFIQRLNDIQGSDIKSLRLLIDLLGVSQAEFARLLGVSRQYISEIFSNPLDTIPESFQEKVQAYLDTLE